MEIQNRNGYMLKWYLNIQQVEIMKNWPLFAVFITLCMSFDFICNNGVNSSSVITVVDKDSLTDGKYLLNDRKLA